MAAQDREFDVIIWGATGFTGQLATASLAGHAAPFFSCELPNAGRARSGVHYAIAGRSEEKLRRVHQECGCPPEVAIFVAEADDEAAIASFVRRTKVVVATAGPFKAYSDVVVGQCAHLGTHYVDITGEAAWARSVIDRYDDVAKASGAVICSMCGFDSIPFDLGALFAINRLRRQSGRANIRRVTAYAGMLNGGFSGGSLMTGISNSREPVQLTKGVSNDDPFVLGGRPKGGVRDEDTDAFTHRAFDLPGGLFAGPSVMHSVNSRVVRRSAKLLNWGPHFNYHELSPAPSKKVAEKMAHMQLNPAPPEVIEKLMAAGKLPKAGEGPKPEVRKVARFVTIIDCEADDGTRLVATMRGGEAGYEETARMVVEAGLTLAQELHSCPGADGGCLTPSAAMGEILIRRLQQIGLPFAVEDGDASSVITSSLGMAQSKL